MSEPSSTWVSLSGLSLKGMRLVRMIYLDEAGSSEHEPFTVDAGIIVHPDHHIERIDALCAAIVADLVPDLGIKPFHAKDIWHGTKDFDRAMYSLDVRREVLKRLAQIPASLSLPVVVGYVGPLQPCGDVTPEDVRFMNIEAKPMMAFMSAIMAAEQWLRQHASDEAAMVIHEDTGNAKALKNSQAYAQSEEFYNNVRTIAPAEYLLPLRRIKNELLFTSKRGTRLLQIADVCAFVIRRRLAKLSDPDDLFSLVAPQLVPLWGQASKLS